MKKKKTNIKERTLYQKIVNVFISIFIVILFLIFLFFGISQTSSFREYLRQTVVDKVNSSINGHLSIDKIEGTILTSLYLKNAIIISEKDTLLNAETIELKTSPLQLLFKNILIRKLELKNTKIELITYKNGKTNLDNVFKTNETINKTETKPFPFIITVSQALLNNVQIYLHDNINGELNTMYDSLTTKNLNIKNINASLAVRIDLNKNYYDLQINSLSCSPNINFLKVKNVKSHIILDNNKIFVDKLNIETSNSNIVLNGTIKKNKLLKAFKNDTFGNASIALNLKSDRLDLSEIGKFIPSILPIDGIVNIDLKAKGKFNNFVINLLEISVGKSHLHINGKVENLDNTDSLNIKAKIIKSVLYADEISQNLKFLNLPDLKDLNEIKIDTLSYTGKEFGFNSDFKISIDEGKMSGNIQMNFLNEETNYFGEIKTENVSLIPVLKLPVTLNSKINVFGTSTDIFSMNSTVRINAKNSIYNNKNFDVLNLSSNVKNGKIFYQIDAVLDSTNIKSKGTITLSKDDNIYLDLTTELVNFNISDITNDSSFATNINLILTGKGVKEKNGKYSLSSNIKLNDSYINTTLINKNNFKINFSGNKDYINNFKINSQQVDAELNGRFTINNTSNIILDEINSLTNVINKEIHKLSFSVDTLLTLSHQNKLISDNKIIPISNDSLKFLIKFKQFNLQSPFIGNDNINISGYLNGRISNNKEKIDLSFESNLDYVKIWGDAGVYFLSNLSLNVNLINDFGLTNLSDLKADINLDTKRVFAGNDIKNIKFNYTLNKGVGALNFNSDIEDKFNIKFKGKTLFNDLTSSLQLSDLKIIFKKYLVQNEGMIDVSYSKGRISFNKFLLSHGQGKLKISGTLNRNENHQLLISFNNINLEDITNNILNDNQFKNVKGVIGLNAKIQGSYLAPELFLDLNVKNVFIDNYKVGVVKSDINYFNKNLALNLFIIDSKNKLSEPILSINGNLPVDLSSENIKNRLIDNANATIKIKANNLNLITVSKFIPHFTNLNGGLYADLVFKGKLNNLLPSGKIYIKNISFISDFNNMKYSAGLKLSADNGKINLDSMYLSNIKGTIDGGVLTGFGNTKLKNYKLIFPRVYLNGELKILNKSSKAVSPLVYGDLVVATQGKAEFILESNKEYLRAPLLVKKADLTFPQAKPSFENTRSNFIYKYVTDTTKVDRDITSFNNLIKLAKQRDSSKTKKKKSSENLVYDINIKVENEASIKFVLDKEFNQVLNANISGDFQYKTVEGTPRAFGTLTLREGSTLDFLTKTFEAGGTLRFENELTNPYLDVVGIYRDYFYEPTIDSSNTSSQEKEVAVKVKLIGPLQDLNKNFVKTKDNLAVYYGTDNIDKDIPDLTKDASDAIMFIVTGHFTTTEEGFTTQQSNALSGTASSIAGSLIGGLLNSYAGDYIRSVELKQVGSYTKFSLSGKVNKFKYTIGGTTEVFQDLGRTNIRIEYPFFQKFFIRVERKESLTESNLLREMINELGIKYKFEF